MGLTNKLCNPTPYRVVIHWEPGRPIIIEPDSTTDISYVQLEDFRPGKPGSAEIQNMLDWEGIFLLDSDKSWESQALTAVQASAKAKKAEFRERVTNLRGMRTASGMKPDDETMDELIQQQGLHLLEEAYQKLEKRAKTLSKAVAGPDVKEADQFDPELTCFGTDIPKEFSSKVQLQMFLDENPGIREKHEAFLAAQE